jgi:hypothetical protein
MKYIQNNRTYPFPFRQQYVFVCSVHIHVYFEMCTGSCYILLRVVDDQLGAGAGG